MVRENSEPQPIGVASIGSNDVHLLVAASDGATRFDRLLDRSAEVELVGAEVEAGGHLVLPAAALASALGVLGDLIARARSAGAQHLLAVGTEGLREAANGAAFCSLLAATFCSLLAATFSRPTTSWARDSCRCGLRVLEDVVRIPAPPYWLAFSPSRCPV